MLWVQRAAAYKSTSAIMTIKHGIRIYDPVTGITIAHEPMDDPFGVVAAMIERLQPLANRVGIVIETTTAARPPRRPGPSSPH